MSRTRRFVAGIRLGLLGQLLPAAAAIAITPLLLNRLGQTSLGLWLIVTQIVTYLSLLDLGVLQLVQREVAFATGQAGADGAMAIDAVVGQSLRLLLLQLPLVALFALGLWMLMPGRWEPLRGPLAVILVAFVLSFPLRLFPTVLYGVQDFAANGWISLGAWAVGTLVTVAGALSGMGLYALAAGWVLQQSLQGIGGLLWLRRAHPGVLPRVLPKLDRELARAWMRRSAWIVVSQLSVILLTGSDLLLVGTILGPESVVVYACTTKLIQLFTNQVNLVAITAQPAISELRGKQDREGLARVVRGLMLAVLVTSGAAGALVLGVNRGFVLWWLDAAQFGGLRLTALVVGLMVLRHFNLALNQIVFAAGHERRLALTGLANGLGSLVVTALAIWKLGLWAAPLGGIAGVLLVSIPANLTVVARSLDAPLAALGRGLAGLGVRAALAWGASLALAVAWLPKTTLELAVASLLVLAIYLALVFRFVLQSPLAAYVRPLLDRALAALRPRRTRDLEEPP